MVRAPGAQPRGRPGTDARVLLRAPIWGTLCCTLVDERISVALAAVISSFPVSVLLSACWAVS